MDAIARRAPSCQEGARQSGGHQMARSTPICRDSLERGEGRRMARKATSRLQRPLGRFRFTLWEPTGYLELSAPNSILCTNPQRYALVFPVIFVVRASLWLAAHGCIILALRSATMCLDIFCIFAIFHFKKACLLPDMILE